MCIFSGISSCNVTNTHFNGNYKCAYDTEEARCTFSCPEVRGLKVQGRLDIEYKCKYQQGVYQPAPLPKCVFRKLSLNCSFLRLLKESFPCTAPGYTIKSGSVQVTHMQQAGRSYHGAFSGEITSELRSQREILLALLAKYKDLERRSVS